MARRFKEHIWLRHHMFSRTTSPRMGAQTSGWGQPRRRTDLNATRWHWYMWMISCTFFQQIQKGPCLGFKPLWNQKTTKLRNLNAFGAHLSLNVMNGLECWAMTPEQDVKAAIVNVKAKLNKRGPKRLPIRHATPMQVNYHSGLDVTPELKLYDIRYNQELIGVLRWAIADKWTYQYILSMLSTHLAMTWEGHIQLRKYHIFGYLKAKPQNAVAFDPRYHDIHKFWFEKCDCWQHFYQGVKT